MRSEVYFPSKFNVKLLFLISTSLTYKNKPFIACQSLAVKYMFLKAVHLLLSVNYLSINLTVDNIHGNINFVAL